MDKNGTLFPTKSLSLNNGTIYRSNRWGIKYSSIYLLFTIFCCFPYIQIIPIPTDSQPYALIGGVIILLIFKPTKLVRELYYLLIVMIWSIIVVGLAKLDFNSIRSVLNYVSLFVIATATYIILSKHGCLKFSWFKKIVYIWGGVALVQQFIYPSFGSFLISRMSGTGSSGRGVTSLAPEPTFYAIICVLLSIICFLNYRNQTEYKKTQWIIWGQILILSRSATVIMLSAGAYIIYRLILSLKTNPKIFLRLVFAACLLLLLINILIPYIEQYRFGNLLIKLLENPQIFITVDESVNERFIHAFFPIYGFMQSCGLPHGFGQFSDYINIITDTGQFSEYIPFVKSNYSRIMSGIGSALFELGLPAMLILIVILKSLRTIYKETRQILLFGILFLFILFNAMPLSNALIGFVLGNLIYCKYHPYINYER